MDKNSKPLNLFLNVVLVLLVACSPAPANGASDTELPATFPPTNTNTVLPTATLAATALPEETEASLPTTEASLYPTATLGPTGEAQPHVSLVYSPIVKVNRTSTTWVVVYDTHCEYNQSKIEAESSRIDFAQGVPGEYFNTFSCDNGKIQHNFAVNVVDEDYQDAQLPIQHEITMPTQSWGLHAM